MTDVFIIIITYNTAELMLAAIQSDYEQTALSFELFVVGNNSSDGSADLIAERFPDVKLIWLDYNAGFAATNSMAAEGSERSLRAASESGHGCVGGRGAKYEYEHSQTS